MNKYVVAVICAVFATMFFAFGFGLKYSQIAPLFAVVSAASAPFVIHKISSALGAFAMLGGLANVVAYPLYKLFQTGGFVLDFLIFSACLGALWTVGFGWKRNWSFTKQ